MIMALGVGAYGYAFFHLVTHAWFKACLFLGSGSVIHSMHHEQDIRNMGGLRKKMPLTYYTFLISTLAISGVPFTSGFLSKDGILAGTLAFANLTGHWLIPIVAFLVAMMTAFYMFRLVILTFHGEPRDHHKYEHAHESPWVMTLPLVILAGLSVFFWYSINPIDPAEGWFLDKWIHTPATVVPQEQRFDFMKTETSALTHAPEATEQINVTHSETYMHSMHSVHYTAMTLSLVVAGLGILFAFIMYQWKKINPDKLADKLKPLYNFSLNKWYIDELYQATFIGGTLVFSKFLAWFDNTIVDGIVNGSAFVTKWISKINGAFDTYVIDGFVNFIAYLNGFIGIAFRKIQTGKVQTYVVYIVFAVIILMFIFKPF